MRTCCDYIEPYCPIGHGHHGPIVLPDVPEDCPEDSDGTEGLPAVAAHPARSWEERIRSCAYMLSVRQPWADDIASGTKTFEYRDRQTHYRGPLLVIAALKPDSPEGKPLPRGVAICLVDVVGMRGVPKDWAWELAHPVRVQPVPVKGALGLIRMTDALRGLLRPA